MLSREHGPQASRRPSHLTLRERHSAQVFADFFDNFCGCIPRAAGQPHRRDQLQRIRGHIRTMQRALAKWSIASSDRSTSGSLLEESELVGDECWSSDSRKVDGLEGFEGQEICV